MGTIALVIVLSHSTAWAQKTKVSAQIPDSVVLGQWFMVPYTIEGADENTRVRLDEKSAMDTVRIVSRLTENKLQVKYALRVNNEVGRVSLPRLLTTNGAKTVKGRNEKTIVKVSDMPWKYDDGKVKAFVKTELSKPYLVLGDTLRVTYKLYMSASEVLDWKITEFHLPSAREFFSMYHRSTLEASDGYEILGNPANAPFFVVELGSYVLQARNKGESTVGDGYISVEYLLDRSDVLTKMFVSERKILDDRRKIIVPIEKVTIQTVEERK